MPMKQYIVEREKFIKMPAGRCAARAVRKVDGGEENFGIREDCK